MTQEIIIIILSSSVVASLISAIITAIIAPQMNWGIEKKKIKLENRKKLLSEVHNIISDEKFDKVNFIKSKVYVRIRPYLSTELDKKIRSDVLVIVKSDFINAGDLLREAIGKELNILEKDWGLI